LTKIKTKGKIKISFGAGKTLGDETLDRKQNYR